MKYIFSLGALLALSLVCQARDVGSSAEDATRYYAEFTIDNTTPFTLRYSVRWNEGEWRTIELPAGKQGVHSMRFTEHDQKFQPQVQFNMIMVGNQQFRDTAGLVTNDVTTGSVWEGGYGAPPRSGGSPKRYVFVLTNEGKIVELRDR